MPFKGSSGATGADAGIYNWWEFTAEGNPALGTYNFTGDNRPLRVATKVVAASDASAASIAMSDYQCDGTDDDVQIQAAIDALPAGGGSVRLSEGNYSTSSLITVDTNVLLELGKGAVIKPDSDIGVVSIAQGGSLCGGKIDCSDLASYTSDCVKWDGAVATGTVIQETVGSLLDIALIGKTNTDGVGLLLYASGGSAGIHFAKIDVKIQGFGKGIHFHTIGAGYINNNDVKAAIAYSEYALHFTVSTAKPMTGNRFWVQYNGGGDTTSLIKIAGGMLYWNQVWMQAADVTSATYVVEGHDNSTYHYGALACEFDVHHNGNLPSYLRYSSAGLPNTIKNKTNEQNYLRVRNMMSRLLDVFGDTKILCPGQEISGTTIQDWGRNNHDATPSEDVKDWDTLPNFEGGMPFLTYNGSDEWLTFGDHADFTFGDGSTDSPFSIVAVFYPTATQSSEYIFGKYDETSGNTQKEWGIYTISGKLYFATYDDSASATRGRYYNTVITKDAWHRIIATYDGSTHKLYDNGSRIDDTALSAGSYTAMEDKDGAVGTFRISTAGAKERIPTGRIGLLALVAKELSADEVWVVENILKEFRGL